MANVSVKEFGKAWWSEVYNRIIGAVVFIDDALAECLHWDGGLFNLLDSGAVAVKSLSPFEFADKDQKKAVFLTQGTSTQLQSIRSIIEHSALSHCILISSVSLDVVFLEMNQDARDVSDVIASGRGSTEATKQLESMLLQWINKEQSAVEVVHIPIFTIPLTNVVFVTPPYHKVYPTFDHRLLPETTSIDLYSLSEEERSFARRLASGINSMMDSLNLKEDIYYMGMYSSLLAGILENNPVCLARRKNCAQPASLILVDRTIDLCGVTSFTTESVLDKIMAVLPRFPGHSTEVAVDMSPLCEANMTEDYENSQLSPGCLYHIDESCVQTYEYMINKSQKEVMFDLYNKLSKIDVQKSPSPKTLLKVTPQSVEKIVTASKGNYDIVFKNLGVLQQALAVVQTLKSPKRVHQELLTSLEKQVLQSLAASRDSTSVLHQICHLIKTRKDRNLPLNSLLSLLVHIYSLTGTEVSFSKQHEDGLTEALSVALFEDHRQIFVKEETCHIVTPEQCDEFAKKIIAKLKEVALMRKGLQKYNSVLKSCETGVGHEYKGVLQQLVDDLVDTERPDISDLKHRNEGFKDLLRSGLSILTSKKTRNTKHPLDNPTLIIFVVGGITAEECKRLHRSVITSGVDNTVIIGATKLVTPVEAMCDVLDL